MLGKQFKDGQFIWLMQRAYCEILKAKKDTVRLNPIGVRNLKGLGTLDRVGLESLLLFMYPNLIF